MYICIWWLYLHDLTLTEPILKLHCRLQLVPAKGPCSPQPAGTAVRLGVVVRNKNSDVFFAIFTFFTQYTPQTATLESLRGAWACLVLVPKCINIFVCECRVVGA